MFGAIGLVPLWRSRLATPFGRPSPSSSANSVEPLVLIQSRGAFLRRLYVEVAEGHLPQRKMVGAIGFEPTTSWSQTRRSTRLSYAPKKEGSKEV